MIDSNLITQLLTAYHLPAVFVGAFFFGESVIITATYLAIQLGWSPITLALAALAGTVTSDTIWFLLSDTILRRLPTVPWFQKQRAQAAELMTRLTGQRPFLALLFIKFLYGSRIAMIFYVASRHVPLLTFSVFNTLGAMIWLAVIIPIVYFAGQSAANLLPLYNKLQVGLVVLIFTALAYRLFSLWLTRQLKPRQ